MQTTEDTEDAEDAEGSAVRLKEVTGDIIDAALRVHSALGPGLLESAYHACLRHELRKRSRSFQSQLRMPVTYDGIRLEAGYRIDFLVEDSVIVEVKAVTKLLPIHEAQLLSYLKLSGRPVGLLLNFHEVHLRDGIKRMIADE